MFGRLIAYTLTFLAACALAAGLSAGTSSAFVIDRVVAYVDDLAITERELDIKHNLALSAGLRPTRAESLQKLINRILLVKEAKKHRIEGGSYEEIVRKYIDLKVRAFIHIRESDVREYYDLNKPEFKGASYSDLKENIRKLLEEEAVNNGLRYHLEQIRSKANILILP